MTPFENNDIDQLLTQVEALLQDERPVEALDLIERARRLEPRHAWMMLFRGVALGQLGRIDEAVDQLIAAADEHTDDIDIQVDTARHLSLFGQAQDALICANRAIAIDAEDEGAHAVLGEVLERLGRISEAVPSRELALLGDPDDADSRYYLAVDLCDLGRYQEAYEVAEPLFGEFADDADIVRLHGACLSYLGRHTDALIKWAELERLEGVTPNLLHNRASTLDVLGRHEEALATIDEAVLAEPDVAVNYYTRGMINEHLERNGDAIEDYLIALAYDHEHIEAAINLVELAAAIDAVDTTLVRVNRLLDAEPSSAKLAYARGRLEMEAGEFVTGQEHIEEAVRREPQLAVGWYTLSILYAVTGNPEKAVNAADRALLEFPDDPGLWLNRGQALHDLKRYPEAMDCYDKAAVLAPDDGIPWFHLGRLLLLDLERPQDARGVLREALRLTPDNDSAAWMLALCYLRLGQTAEAEQELQRLMVGYPDHLWGRLVQAALHAQRGEIDDAFTNLRIATEQGYDTRLLLHEPLFEPLWADPRFDGMLRGATKRHRHPEGRIFE